MADPLSDVLLGAADAGMWTYPYGSNQHNIEVESRRKNIEDNLGIKTESFKEFKSQNGGSTLSKGLKAGLVVAGIIAVAGVGIFGLSAIAGAIGLGIFGGVIAGVIRGELYDSKKRKEYNINLDEVSAQGRQQRDQGIAKAVTQEYDNGTPGKSYVADLEASRSRARSGAQIG